MGGAYGGVWSPFHGGLRPSELLSLRKEDVSFPPGADGNRIAILRLGAQTGGTKAKREQFAILRQAKHPDAFELLERLVRSSSVGALLVPYSLVVLRKTVQHIDTVTGLKLGVAAHSPRAGFATGAIAEGESRAETQAAGRWSTSSRPSRLATS